MSASTDTVAVARDGRPVLQVTLRSPSLEVRLLSVGASVRQVVAPDAEGRPGPVHLTLDDPTAYLDRDANPYLGATVGRYANRIRGARFPLDGREVVLVADEGGHQLHGGPDGFAHRHWDLDGVEPDVDGGRARFTLVSPDGDQGFPGRLEVTATYVLAGPTLGVTYTATTDAPTVVNLAHHGYWHLGGAADVSGHHLAVTGSHVLPVDGELLPSGPLEPVAGTPFDLRGGVSLGDVLAGPLGGLDHCYAVDGPPARVRHAATLWSPATGRWLRVRTDQPGVQVCTAGFLGPPFVRHGAVCLEPQRFPDTPHHPDLGSAELRPGEEYRSVAELTLGCGDPPAPVRAGDRPSGAGGAGRAR